jgi:tRNA G18 (ribose-2'-O)-methylase SpoU
MIRVQTIDSFDRPGLGPYRTMRYQYEHRQQGIFVAEGEKVVRRLIESPLKVVSVMLPEKWLGEYERLLAARPEEIEVFVGPKELLETLIGFSMYQGLLAVAQVPPAPRLEALLGSGTAPQLWVATAGLSNALNMGALIRNCAAFGAHALIVSETCCSPFLRRAVRASMGAVFRLPCLEAANLVSSLRVLRERGVRVVAAHPHAERRTLTQADLRGNVCIVLGSEGEGLRPDVLAVCDEQVLIPMAADVDSLNVASASAVFLYEAWRQRTGGL